LGEYLGGISYNVPDVYDGLTARIRACLARSGLAKCGCSEPWEWSEIVYDREKYKNRSLIERIFGKIKENRRLTVRYEKSDINFHVLVTNSV
jgi:transposase